MPDQKTNLIWILFVLFFTLALTLTSLFSQTSTATLLGTVSDSSGGVVPNAEVTVRNIETGIDRTTLSNALGEYVVALLQPGEYEISVQAAGFRRFLRSGLTLQVNDRTRVPVELKTGGISDEVVVVEADASLLNRDSSTLGAVVTKTQISDLPLNGRDVFHLTYLVQGSVPEVEGSSSVYFFGGAVSVNGMREQANNFLLDGVDNNVNHVPHSAASPPLDSVQEFKVQSGVYSAEFGNHAGAQLNFVTRSGSNRLRGSLYGFHRNAVLDAKNYFDLPDKRIPKFIRNQFGFSVGGPIAKNRTFLFGNYEGFRERKAITRLGNVPRTEFINGDFSSLAGPIFDPRTNKSEGPLCYDPATGDTFCEPFAGNIIPVDAMDPIGAAIAKYFPAPNDSRPGGNLLSQPVRDIELNQFVIRLDHQLTEKDSLLGRYAFYHQDRFDPFATSNVPGFGDQREIYSQNAAVGWIHSFGPQLLNDLRLAYVRYDSLFLHENVGNDISSKVGINGLSTDPLRVGFPGTYVYGYDYLIEDPYTPIDGADNTYQVIEGLIWHKGKHVFKVGVDLRHLQENMLSPTWSRGLFVFWGLYGDPVADLLLGKAYSVQAGDGEAYANMRNWAFSVYFQDDFRITDQLTLNYGLRYEYSQPPYDVFGRFTQPDLDSETSQFIFCGEEGLPKGCTGGDPNNFAPRLGLAWSPFSGKGFVIRAGYGIFYEVGMYQSLFGMWQNPPNFSIHAAYLPASLANPLEGGLNVVNPFFMSDAFPLASAQHWTLNFQNNFRDTLVELGYAGSRGTHLLTRTNPNQWYPDPQGETTCVGLDRTLFACSQSYPVYGSFDGREAGSSSSYHSAWLRAERRMRNGLAFQGSYTFSKSIDDSSALTGSVASGPFAQDYFNRRAEKGLSIFDMRHRLTLNYIWQLPVGRGRQYLGDMEGFSQAVLGDWQCTGTLTFGSSRPFTPRMSRNTQDLGDARPDLAGDPHLDDPDPDLWINSAAFQKPEGAFGNAGRNILRGPGYGSVDLGLLKNFLISESSRLQFRAEFFNLFNHPNFDLPQAYFDSQSFGRVRSARDSRQIQFGLRFEF